MAAQARVVGPLLRKLASMCDDLSVTADRVPIGSVVRVAGEWATVLGFDGTHLRLAREDSACEWTYEVGHDETFIYDEGEL